MECGYPDKLYCPTWCQSRKGEYKFPYEENDDSTVWTTIHTKNPKEYGVVGNQYTINVATNPRPNRGQKAQIHGLSGLSPVDQLAVNQPPRIWNGKSMRTAAARSSLLNPFSIIFNEVTASLAAKPTFAKKCMTISSCTSDVWSSKACNQTRMTHV